MRGRVYYCRARDKAALSLSPDGIARGVIIVSWLRFSTARSLFKLAGRDRRYYFFLFVGCELLYI